MKFLLFLFLFASLWKLSFAKISVDEDERSLVIGTFNLEWLGDGVNDKVKRSAGDYKRIANIIRKSEVEVFALQEVENEKAMKKLLKNLKGWKGIFKPNGTLQNQAYIFRDYINVLDFKLFDDLDLENNHTRKGIILRISYGGENITFLNVHLKSTSRYDNTAEKKLRSFALRKRQSAKIAEFVKGMNKTNSNVVVLGDFNDNPMRGEKSNILELEKELIFPTKELKSCKEFYFDVIDHIAINKYLIDNLDSSSPFMFDTSVLYKDKHIKKISDHCPVILKLNF